MVLPKTLRGFISIVSLIAVPIFFQDCSGVQPNHAPIDKAFHQAEGRLVMYLTGMEESGVDLTVSIHKIRIENSQGAWTQLLTAPINVNSLQLGKKRVVISNKTVPKGQYRAIELTYGQATLIKEGKTVNLIMGDREYKIDHIFEVLQKTDNSITLEWMVEASIYRGYVFKPSFRIQDKR